MDSPAAPAGTATGGTATPARADGVELLGEQPGSGYRQAPCLVRRADGQTLQLTPLLYRVLEAIDGERDLDGVAATVGERVGRRLSADDVAQLVAKLQPLGVLRLADGTQPEVRTADPLLGLRFRWSVTDPETTRRLTAPFAVLFRPLVVAVVVPAFVLTTVWLLGSKGLASATAEAFDSPGLLLLVLVFTLLSAGFHEFGHAAACRYGGATPGAMGAGLYLVWPAFYTDVGDSYRLGRAGRLRVDLGGLYFNALFAVAVVGLWAVVRFDALLLLVVAQVLQMVRQLTPLVRFDGYHVLADLTGVPDLFSRIGPTLRGLLPWNWGDPEGKVLRPWARVVVTAWVLVVVPLLLGCLALVVVTLPRVVATAWAGLQREGDALGAAWADGDPAAGLVGVFAMAAVALPLLGIGYVLVRLARRTGGWAWRRTHGSRPARGALLVLAALLAGVLAWAWWPDGSTYRPVTSDDRGTLLDVLPRSTVGQVDATGASAADQTPVRAPRTVVVGLPEEAALPTEERPVPALVLMPKGEAAETEPTWVFPFGPPTPPGEDDNQAYALNTEDGSTVYEVSFALVWVDGDEVTSRNEAYALAGCERCTTVAVAFQVVLVTGETSLAIPQNVAAAVNVDCVECLTYALATQLVLSVPDGLSDDGVAELQALWSQLLGQLDGLTLDELAARLADVETEIVALVERDQQRTATAAEDDAGTTPTPTPIAATSTTPAPSPTALSDTASPSPSPDGTPATSDAPEPSPEATPAS